MTPPEELVEHVYAGRVPAESKERVLRFVEIVRLAHESPSGADILDEVADVAEELLRKNKAYGDSALEPIRVFSKASPIDQILVRLDDKLNRIAKGSAAGEDPFFDIIGYLVLLRVAKKRNAVEAPPTNSETKDEPKTGIVATSPCQECGKPVEAVGDATCDTCFENRHGRPKVRNVANF